GAVAEPSGNLVEGNTLRQGHRRPLVSQVVRCVLPHTEPLDRPVPGLSYETGGTAAPSNPAPRWSSPTGATFPPPPTRCRPLDGAGAASPPGTSRSAGHRRAASSGVDANRNPVYLPGLHT